MPRLQNALKRLTPWGIIASCGEGTAPRDRDTVAAYAEEFRVLSDGAQRYENTRTPYAVEPQEKLTSREHQTVAVVGPGQVAKTVIAENWLLHSVGTDPANFLWYMQDDAALEAFVKDRINPMIDHHDAMSAALGPRPIDDSLHYKRFRGMSAQFLTAVMSNMISKNAPRIVADEIDAYKKLFGNVKALLDVRRQVYGDDSMMLAISHPDLAEGLKPDKHWSKGIMAFYGDSTRCMWYWKCPHCGLYSSPCPIADRYMPIEWPKDGTLSEIEAGAYLACPTGCVIIERERIAMNDSGVWIGIGQEISEDGKVTGKRISHHTAGYWIVGAMSPFPLGGIGGLARNRVAAERELENTGEDNTLRQVVVKMFGFPYERGKRLGNIDANDLADRAEADMKLGEVPEGVRFITAVADVQQGSFEWMRRGWGVAGESWVIDRGSLKGEPATDPLLWDQLLALLGAAVPLADGSGRKMLPRGVGFDSMGVPGVTEQAYAGWARWRKARKISLYGQVAGREAWSVLPLKGAQGLNAPRLVISYPDTARKVHKVAGKGDVPVGIFNPNGFKDALGGQLMKAEAGPWYVHFPQALRSKEPPHRFFEEVVAEQQLPNGRWEKIVANSKNEALDQLVMTHVLAHLHGVSKINWDAWAAPWDQNTLVMKAGAVSPAGAPIAPAAQASGAVKITIDQAGKKNIGSRIA
jgi:phage terminase large subunit GpA-like protein